MEEYKPLYFNITDNQYMPIRNTDANDKIEYRVIPVHNATPPKPGDTYHHETGLGNKITVEFTDTTPTPYRNLGEQQTTIGTITINRDITGNVQYRHESSLLVITFTPPSPLEHYLIIEYATPFEMYSYVESDDHWGFINRADSINEVIIHDTETRGKLSLLDVNPEDRNDKLDEKIHEAHLTFNDEPVEVRTPVTLTMNQPTTIPPFEAHSDILSTYEDVLVSRMRSDGIQVTTTKPGERQFKYTNPSNSDIAWTKLNTVLNSISVTENN